MKAEVNGTANAKAPAGLSAKQLLARSVVEAMARDFADASPEERRQVAYWLHSLPTGGADGSHAGGAKRWWPVGGALPRPTTSDWT